MTEVDTTIQPLPIMQQRDPQTELLEAGELGSIVLDDLQEFKVFTNERFATRPMRHRGLTLVRSAVSFAELMLNYANVFPFTVFVDQDALRITAVLNDHRAELPGWRDYRVQADVVHTPEWQAWIARDGKLEGQEAFAEHIEENLIDIIDPAGGAMLEIAQSFHASVNSKFEQKSRLKSGAIQLVYTEEMDATSGAIPVPDKFTLLITPFYGAEAIKMDALVRFRVRNGQLIIGYKLQRPQTVVRECFAKVVAELRPLLDNHGLNFKMVDGPAPQALLEL